MKEYYFEEIYNLSDQQNTFVRLVFLQSKKEIKFIGSMYAPVIINPDNVNTYIPFPNWNLFLNQIHSDRHFRDTRYRINKEKDPTVGTLTNPL